MELIVFIGYYVVVGIVLALLVVLWDEHSRDVWVTTTSELLRGFIQIIAWWFVLVFLLVLFSSRDCVRGWKWN